eukprot:COSAG02_NODE_10425_length_1943_cov_3.301518_2_plen_42_part_00
MNFLAAPLQAIEKGDADKVRQIAALLVHLLRCRAQLVVSDP